jgi:hypothetical protein
MSIFENIAFGIRLYEKLPKSELEDRVKMSITRPNPTTPQGQRTRTVFKSTVFETEHAVVEVHPLTGERAIIVGYFVRKLLGPSIRIRG